MAKVTQRRYGAKSHAAGREIFAKAMMVKRIANQSITISTNAAPMLCMPKKIRDHTIFNTNCRPKSESAIRTCSFFHPLLHTKHAAIPMNANNNVHTGPKTQFGGAKGERTNPAYQVGIAENVNIEPMFPASSARRTAIPHETHIGYFFIRYR